jgi:hypothetical protein
MMLFLAGWRQNRKDCCDFLPDHLFFYRKRIKWSDWFLKHYFWQFISWHSDLILISYELFNCCAIALFLIWDTTKYVQIISPLPTPDREHRFRPSQMSSRIWLKKKNQAGSGTLYWAFFWELIKFRWAFYWELIKLGELFFENYM